MFMHNIIQFKQVIRIKPFLINRAYKFQLFCIFNIFGVIILIMILHLLTILSIKFKKCKYYGIYACLKLFLYMGLEHFRFIIPKTRHCEYLFFI